jgi:hypothetical protein
MKSRWRADLLDFECHREVCLIRLKPSEQQSKFNQLSDNRDRVIDTLQAQWHDKLNP